MAMRASRPASLAAGASSNRTRLRPRRAVQIDGGDASFLRRRTKPIYSSESGVRLVDLFCGCGGMTLGAIEACRALGLPCEVVLAMEIDERIRDVYDANFKSSVEGERGNVRSRFEHAVGERLSRRERETRRDVGEVALLIGGPPCQGHSNLNNHTRWADPKNALYMRMVRAAEVLEPETIMIENVPGIRKDQQRVLERATRRLEDLGYSVSDGDVPLVEIGVPQLRVRHVLIASKSELSSVADVVAAHTVSRPRSLRWALRDFPSRSRNGVFDAPSRLSPENRARAQWLLSHREYDLPNELRPRCHRDVTHKYKSMYGRLRWNEPSQTITTGFGSPGQGRYLHPSKPRALTPHEAARLQFFPDWFDFSAAASNRSTLANCIGNAVPPKLSFAFVRRLLIGFGGTQSGVSDGSGARLVAAR